MVKKPVERIIKLHVPAGEATLAPPVGPALGQHLQDPMKFCPRAGPTGGAYYTCYNYCL